jgi:glycosyltransferase involved in cell wall biosynthesis
MSEKRILLASLLKTVSDTRMYEKLGLSLLKLPGVSVHICGYKAPIPADAPANISFYPIFNFTRLSLGRVQAQVKYYRLLLALKPAIVIISTHELLLATLLYKRRHSCQVLYDIQENYSLNLRAQHNYSWPVKHLLAGVVRTVEQLSASAVDHFLLAEKSYAEELPFIDQRYTLLENKYKPRAKAIPVHTPVSIPGEGPLRLLYSGTIAAEYGVFEAIDFAEQLHELHPDVYLTIIGYCANKATWERIEQETKGKEFIRVIGGSQLVPHQQILEQIRESHIGLLPYRPNESTLRCIPTKLYEYMAHGLPILIQQNPLWHAIVERSGAGMSIDFSRVEAPSLIRLLYQQEFYTTGIPDTIYWKSEEEKLLRLMTQLEL